VARQFELFFPNRDVLAAAELLDDLAPRTCQLFWEQLPLAEETYHTRRSGCELFVSHRPGLHCQVLRTPRCSARQATSSGSTSSRAIPTRPST